MRFARLTLVALLTVMTPAAHASEPDDWSTFGRMLSLVQGFMQIAVESQSDPKRVDRHVDALLSGKNADANKLLEEAFADMPGEQRGQVLGIARSLAILGQKQAAVDRRQAEEAVSIQARKDLAGMGLSYFDRSQFIDAIKRGDRLAVQLYLGGRGVDPKIGLESARGAGLGEMERLLAEAVTGK